MRENGYQAHLIKRLKKRFPDCFILKNDTDYLQGVPDLLILNGERWAMLEVKPSEDAPLQPNQDFYINLLGGMGYASFIYPENEEVVLRDLQLIFAPQRSTRFSQS